MTKLTSNLFSDSAIAATDKAVNDALVKEYVDKSQDLIQNKNRLKVYGLNKRPRVKGGNNVKEL